MKKIKINSKIFLLLFLFTISFVKINSISAKETIYYEWGEYPFSKLEFATHILDVVEVKDGYLIYGKEANHGDIISVKYDKNGKEIYNKDSNQQCETFLGNNGEKLYCVNRNQFIVMDLDFENSIQIPLGSYYSQGIRKIIEDEDYFYIIGMYLLQIKKSDLTITEINSFAHLETIETLKNYYKAFEIIFENETNAKYYYDFEIENEKILLIYYDEEKEIHGFELYDDEGNKIISDELESFLALNVAIQGDSVYIARIELSENEEETQAYISKYNTSGTKLYEISTQKVPTRYLPDDNIKYFYEANNHLAFIKAVENGLLLAYDSYYSPESIEETIEGEDGAIIKYSFSYDIETKTDGNGEIKAISTSKVGEAVTFEVTPKEGFVLGVVKVMDANGNVVYFTSNTFTMPSSDVTIEATFLPKNPDTKDIGIAVLLLLFIIGGIMLVRNKKKLNALK